MIHCRNLTCKRVEYDEIWSFCYTKERNISEEHKRQFDYDDIWTFVAIDADSKLILSWLIGKRELEDALTFTKDIKSDLLTESS